MPTPVNRAKVQLVRGSFSNISASISDLTDGELCYAKDQNRLYMVEGTTLTEIESSPENIESIIASVVTAGTGITATHNDALDKVTIDIANTSVTAGSYGSSTTIPQITVDQQGRITAATTASISTDMIVAADSGSNQTISIGTDTFTVSGGTGLSSITSADTVTVNLDNTTVTAASYGSATAIPVITVDQQGRITAASTSSVNTTTNLGTSAANNAVTVTSSTGNDATISEANASDAGVMSVAHHDKLDGIEASADVTDATNVDAAGAVMNSDSSTASMSFVTDQDNMSGDSATKVPTQQSVKAYVDSSIDGLVDGAPGALNTLNELAAALGDNASFSSTVTSNIASKLPLAGGTITGNIVMSGSETVDGRDLSADGSKLDGIASGAQVNAVTSVNGQTGAVTVSGSTDLTYTAATRVLASSTGTNATFPNVTAAGSSGLMTGADKTKLNGIATGAQVNAVTSVNGSTGAVTIAAGFSGNYNDLSNKPSLFNGAYSSLSGRPTLGTAAATNTTAYATAAQGALAASAIQPGDPNPVMVTATSNLPSASSNHGAVVHVHNEGALYFAHSGAWVKLLNASINGLPALP